MSNQQLVTITNGVPSTTTIAIAEGTGNDHASVIKMVRAYQDDLEGFGLLDFKSESTSGRPTEYATLNERQATLIISYMRNSEIVRAFKIRLVRRFYEMAEDLNSGRQSHGFQIPQTLAGALQLAADQARQIEAQTAQITVMAPKADFHDRVTQSLDLLTVREVAKILRTGERRMFGFLRQEGLLMKSNVPYQQFMDRNLFRLVETPWVDQYGRERISVKTCITQKGLVFIQGLQDRLSVFQETA
jgi:phage antirepressor YoqD-like protein